MNKKPVKSEMFIRLEQILLKRNYKIIRFRKYLINHYEIVVIDNFMKHCVFHGCVSETENGFRIYKANVLNLAREFLDVLEIIEKGNYQK